MRTRVSEEKLLLFQSKKSLFNFGLFKKFILSPFNTLGTIQGLTNNYGTVLSCTASTAKRVGYCAIPSEPSFRCNVVGKCSIYIGLASAYVALIANALPILHANSAQSVATQNILSRMNFLTDLLTTHDFFLLVFSSVFSNAISVEIDTAQFFLWIVIPSLVLACLVNNDARFKIYEKLGCYQPPFGYRKNIARISDLVCGFIKGGMFGIPLVNTIQSIADYIQHAPSNSANSWRCSLEGLITRYSIGIGLFASTEAMLYWKYNPFSEGGVDFNRMEFISNVEGIVGTILILSYFIPALLNNQKIDIIVLTGIMI